MKILLRYKDLSIAYYIACMLSLLLFTFLDMRNMEHGVEAMIGAQTLTVLCVMVCLGSALKLYCIPQYKLFIPDKVMLFYLAYLLWVFVPILMNGIENASFVETFMVLMRQIMPILTLLITYNYVRNHGDSKWFGVLFCIMSLTYGYGYLSILFELRSVEDVIQMIVSYYVLYVLPLIMLVCKKKTRVFFILFTLVLLISSVKRGGIVALAGGLVVYGMTYFLASKKIKLTAIIGGLVIVTLLVGLFFYMGSSDESNLIERFESIEEDGGSGRSVVWYKTAMLLDKSDAGSLIFGHGYNRVALDSQLGLSAHNDFLEVCYDYGIIGLILYLLAFVAFGVKVLRFIWNKSPYAPAMAMFFAIYFMLSMISHIIIYSWANVMLLTVSYVCALEKVDETDK